jgi:hypothetical protein
MKKNINLTTSTFKVTCLILLLALCCFCTTLQAQKADKKDNITQSTFYDAQALYYALRGYNAFVVSTPPQGGDTGSIAQFGNAPAPDIIQPVPRANPGPGITPAPTPNLVATVAAVNNTVPANKPAVTPGQIFKVYELTSGKLLVDDVTQSNLDAFLNKHKFASDTARTAFINNLLIKNLSTDGLKMAGIAEAGPDQAQRFTKLKYYYHNNTYLNNFWGDVDYQTIETEVLNAESAKISGIGGGVPSVSVNDLADGLVRFYIARVNDEVNDAFFIHLQEVLSKIPELSILFPETLKSLNKIKVTNYNQSLNAIKSSYQTDIKNLLKNVSGLATISRYKNLINNHHELTLLFAACDLIAMVQQGNTAPDILYNLGNAPYIQAVKPNDYNAFIRMAAVVSNAFVDRKLGDDPTTSLSWILVKNLSILKDNDDLFRIFMGLFAENAQGIKIGNFDFYSQLNTNSKPVLDGRYIVYNFGETLNALNKKLQEASNTKLAASAKVGLYIDAAGQIFGLADKCLGVLPENVTVKERLIVKKIRTTYIPLLYTADSVAYHIEKQEYSAAVLAADELFTNLFAHRDKKTIDKEITSLTTLKSKSPADTSGVAEKIAALNTEKLTSDTLQNLQSDYLKYGAFIAAIAEAQSADDVKKAIQAFALPVGSSRIKKEHHFSWGLNSYVGFYHAWNQQFMTYNLPHREAGITAPLGMALNFSPSPSAGSFSLYGGIIDVGAIFTYTVNTDKSVQSEIKLGQLLSPSIGLVYGLPIISKYNIPLSIGTNYQWGPRLHGVDNAGNSILRAYTGRINIFIALDLPIVNFHVSQH